MEENIIKSKKSKKLMISLIIIVILLVGYVGYDLGIKKVINKIILNSQEEIMYQIVDAVSTCQQVPLLSRNNQQVNVIAVECLQQ